MDLPPAYIITMPGGPRNPNLVKSLVDIGFDCFTQEAVIGNQLKESELNTLIDLNATQSRLGYRISNNLIGCALSHRKVYSVAKSRNSDWIIVFEEDAELIDLNCEEVIEICEKNSSCPTIIQFFSRSARLIDKDTICGVGNRGRILFEFLPRLVGSGTAGYLINSSAIDLALNTKIHAGAPDWPDWSYAVKFMGIYPWAISESDMGTSIPKLVTNRKTYVTRRLQQLTGLHFIHNREYYSSLRHYLKEEIIPYFYYLLWIFKGKQFLYGDPKGPQIL